MTQVATTSPSDLLAAAGHTETARIALHSLTYTQTHTVYHTPEQTEECSDRSSQLLNSMNSGIHASLTRSARVHIFHPTLMLFVQALETAVNVAGICC